jgi:hypothetical protein
MIQVMCLKSHRDLTERLDWLQSSFIIHHFEFNMWQDTQIVTSLCCISILPICFRIFFTGFILLFSSIHQNTPTIFTLIYPFLMLIPSHWDPPPEKTWFYLSVFHVFWKCILISKGVGVAVTFQICIFRILIRLTSHYLLFLYHHTPLLFNSLQRTILYYIIFTYKWDVSICFHSLPFSFPPP